MCCYCHSVSATLPSGQLSNVPWRRTGVKYNNNEAYFDVIEEIDAIIDKSGSVVSAEIQGYVSVESFPSPLIKRSFILCFLFISYSFI
jgi:AP-3 complex subunit mu